MKIARLRTTCFESRVKEDRKNYIEEIHHCPKLLQNARRRYYEKKKHTYIIDSKKIWKKVTTMPSIKY